MTPYQKWISFYTMVRKDVVRMFRIWVQTFLPSVITSSLYFLIFGSILGERIGEVHGVDYMTFVVPGLVMLSIVTNSYANTSFVFFQSKFFARSIEEILVSPTPPWIMIAGFVTGGLLRGIIVGTLVLVVAVLFTGIKLAVASLGIILLFGVLASLVFSLAGLVNGIYARSIDGINFVPTFVLTPLIYLGGVFYSVDALPGWWEKATHLNPLFYIINGFRYGFLGISDVPLWISITLLLALIVALVTISWYLIRRGLGLRQ
jgi:ABC-2 type transport system permease protein